MKKRSNKCLFNCYLLVCFVFMGCVSRNGSIEMSQNDLSKLLLNTKYSRKEFAKHHAVPGETPEMRKTRYDTNIQFYKNDKKVGTSCKIEDKFQVVVKDINGDDYDFMEIKFQNLNQALSKNGKVLRQHSLVYEYGESIIRELNSISAPVPITEIERILSSAKSEEYEVFETGNSLCSSSDLSRTVMVTDLVVLDEQGNEIEMQLYKEFFMQGTECP